MYHEMTYRVPYADTDQMGVVYYANYLEYFERGRTEMLRDAGLPYSELEKSGIRLPVSEVEVKYLGSARYDDLLVFRTWVEGLKGVRLRVACEVRRDDRVLVRGVVTLACIGPDRKPRRPSEELKAACRRLETVQEEVK